ncbi:MAG: LysM peptidoglycan-binding domain-containing protein [Treponema sp.]|nr:LysM peptidoglycan-binding domain-containing protein [Treponema sp.]
MIRAWARRIFPLLALSALLVSGGAAVFAQGETPAQPHALHPAHKNPQRSQRSVPPTEPLNRPAAGPSEPFLPENSLLRLPGALENSLTQSYIRRYEAPAGRETLAAAMRRAGPYLAFIRGEIAAADLPEELVYLPVIESAYMVTAVSRSGAAGLWQFMLNSISPFDMSVTTWMDQRRDFWKSTDGALRKLRGNYKFFEDWALALAAYNAGLGGLQQLIKRNGVDDYWVLSQRRILRDETIHYVPRLIATSYVLSNQRRFGMEPDWPENPHWQRIPTAGTSVDLNLLADVSGADRARLLLANRELVYNITPPEKGFYLKVQGVDAERVAAALARNDIALLRYHIHTVRSGDTLLALARHFGVSVEQIQTANPDIRERNMRLGSRLLIPVIPTNEAVILPPEPELSPEDFAFEGTHTVRQGDTLWSLSRAFGIPVEVLAAANGMQINDVLREGRVIKTPIQ